MKIASLIVVTFGLAIVGLSAQETGNPFKTVLVQVTASDRQVSSLPESLRETAIVDNKITYLVAKAKGISKGIDPKLIIGLLKDPSKGLQDGNITINPMFLKNVFLLAAKNLRDEVLAELKRNKFHTVIIFDERVQDINLSLKENINDIIGFLHLENEQVSFEPNDSYTYFSKNGFMRLNEDIRKQIEGE